MTPRKRIFLNILATYGRSLFSLVCGLFAGRWLLASLGEVDFGLYGLVGGLTIFITFFNNILAAAIARFYAYAVGEATIPGKEVEGLENCRSWFNTAVALHTIFPTILMIIGYPLGVYAVEHWLTIPADRVADCVWVFRWVCVMTFVSMVNVPFNAMYVAKQMIAELTIYSVFTTIVNVAVLYYMVRHPGVWLTIYTFTFCCAAIIPQLVIIARALIVFPECVFVRKYFFSGKNLKHLSGFVGWQLIGHFGQLIKGQGIAILVNKMFGPVMNASMAVGSQVSAQTDTLASAMSGAFMPAITNKVGAQDHQGMLSMTYRACKFGALLSLFFILPLSVELDAIIHLWLVNPPALAVEICYFMLAIMAIDEMNRGVTISITANGKLALYYTVIGGSNIITLPLAWFAVVYGWNSCLAIMGVLLAVRFVSVFIAAWIAQGIIGLDFFYWLKEVVLNCLLLIVSSLVGGFLVKASLSDYHYIRILASLSVTTLIFMVVAWRIVLNCNERDFFSAKLRSIFRRFV